MRNTCLFISAVLLSLFIFFDGCTGYSSTTRDNITVKDSLALKGICVITGTVTDKATNKPIRGANIVIFSKPISTVTDLYGQFDILDVQPGTYTLQVFCVGYIQKDIPDIEAKPDRFIRLDMRLEPRSTHSK